MERLAASIADVGTASYQHFALLRDLGELRRLVRAPLPLEPDEAQVRAIGQRLGELKRGSLSSRSSSKSRRTQSRSLSEKALDALGDGPIYFPAIEEAEEEEQAS